MARYRRNPHYAVEGKDEYGKVCYFIYNDDGTKTHRFCFTPEKVQDIIDKADRVEARQLKRDTPPPLPGERRTRKPRPVKKAVRPSAIISPEFMGVLTALVPLMNFHIRKTCATPFTAQARYGRQSYCKNPPHISGFDKKRRYIYAMGSTGQQEFRIASDTGEVWRLSAAGSPWYLGTATEILSRGKTVDEDWAENNPYFG